LLRAFSPLSSFQHQFFSFDLTLIKVFKWLLSPCFFKCLKAFLVHRQVSLPIFNGGIGIIYIETIALITYLGNWALVAHVIVFRLLLDSHPFLLEVIGANSLGFTPLPGALEVVLGASPPGCINIFTPILATCKKGSKSISRNYFNRLHDHSFSKIISNMAFDSH
jgi:hypothetical protein